MAPANPLRGLASDARYIASVADEIDGPVMLVGHWYGGAVVTVAGSLTGNVVGLVYVAALCPRRGESVLDVSAPFPDSLLTAHCAPPSASAAMASRPSSCTSIETHSRGSSPPTFRPRPLRSRLPRSARSPPRRSRSAHRRRSWKTLQCWYVLATADRVIDPAAQRFMAARAAARTLEVDASHAVATSQPALVADHIRQAALAARRVAPVAVPLRETTPFIGPKKVS